MAISRKVMYDPVREVCLALDWRWINDSQTGQATIDSRRVVSVPFRTFSPGGARVRWRAGRGSRRCCSELCCAAGIRAE